MMPPVSSRSARDDAQYLNDEAGTPADSTIAAHCNDRDFGTSRFGSTPSMLHETVAVREAVHGPKRRLWSAPNRSRTGGKRTRRCARQSVAIDPTRHFASTICRAAQLSDFYSLWSGGNSRGAVAGVHSAGPLRGHQ
jgi:hypothetical protein